VRDAIRHCIYGVDINPLAVELCKVALWLEAHNPGEPLNFLDHRIKCGNAIVGLARQEELERGIPDEAFKTLPDDEKEIAAQLRKQNKAERKRGEHPNADWMLVQDIPLLYKELAEIDQLPETTPEEIAAKQKRYQDYQHSYHREHLKAMADIQVAQFFIPKREEHLKGITTHDQYWGYMGGGVVLSEATAMARAVAKDKRFFHWFLEFPEVFEKGGFDCIVGNPPYLGDKKQKRAYGESFQGVTKWEFSLRNACDLVAFFYRRIFDLLKGRAFAVLISTNTVAQGSTREQGLDRILKLGGNINFAISATKWPGRANVVVSMVGFVKGAWNKQRLLDGRVTNFITGRLREPVVEEEAPNPYKLQSNNEIAYIGTYVNGTGFFLTPHKAQDLLSRDPALAEVIRPHINGDDLYDDPRQGGSRFVIDFRERSEEEARKFSECFKIVEELVYPVRSRQSDRRNREKWWLHARPRKELYEIIDGFDKVLAIAKVSRTCAVDFVDVDQVLDEKLIVFALWKMDAFAFLQSFIHWEWAWFRCTTMKHDLSYGVQRIVNTLPIPYDLRTKSDQLLFRTGNYYHEHRRQLMLKMQLGLTKTYNLFHALNLSLEAVEKASKQSAEIAAAAYEDILKLRDLHREMDEAVLAAYGWQEDSEKWGHAIELRHDFYEVDYLPENDRIRYTIHPNARREILKRLLLLNHERYEEEVRQGLHDRQTKKKKAARKKVPASTNPAQQSLL
jgi:hypothetical protein